MPIKPIKITLFHADWCGHCNNFKPVWEKMSSDTNACKNIEFEDYEEQSIGNLAENDRIIDGSDVRSFGYPTLKITVNDNSYVYNGRRTPEDIYKSVYDIIKKNNKHVEISSFGRRVSDKEKKLKQMSEQLNTLW